MVSHNLWGMIVSQHFIGTRVWFTAEQRSFAAAGSFYSELSFIVLNSWLNRQEMQAALRTYWLPMNRDGLELEMSAA